MTVPPARLPAALIALAVGLGAAGCAGTDAAEAPGPTASSTEGAAQSRRIEVEYAGGRVSGDTGRVAVTAGTPVVLVLTSDVADEVHVHGYDVTTDLVPGRPAELAFDATIPGVFEVELHDAGTVLLTLQVQ